MPNGDEINALRAKISELGGTRNDDNERLWALEIEASKLRDALINEEDAKAELLAVIDPASAKAIAVRPNLGKHHLDIYISRAFLIMPFGPEWSHTVEGAVSLAARSCGMQCDRADNKPGRNIMGDTWKSICESGVVVADITDSSPNVMYELGLCDAIGKQIVLISQTANPTDVPFDLRGLRLIVYSLGEGGLNALSMELGARLRTARSAAAGL